MQQQPFPLCFLALAALASVGAAEEPARPYSPQAGDYGEPRVVVAAPAEARYAHLSWPKIARAPDGTLVLAYVAGIFHGTHGGGCPAVSLSTDRGRTFTPPRILMEFGPGQKYTACGNVALGVADDGAVVLLAMAYAGGERNTVVGWRSPDAGKTWERVNTDTLAENKTGSVFGHIVAVPGRGLAVFGHYRAGSKPFDRGLWLAWSKDGGRSWGEPQRIVSDPLVEPAVTFAQGRFVGLIRESASKQYWQLLSEDLGATWAHAPAVVGADRRGEIRFPSPFLAFDPAEPSRLYALESNRHARGNTPGAIHLWSANAKDLDWQPHGVVARFPKNAAGNDDFSYPWMTPLGGGEWFLVFYSGQMKGPNSIYGLAINPEPSSTRLPAPAPRP